jgi:hypothetical protein
MSKNFELISNLLLTEVRERFTSVDSNVDLEFSDNFAEVLEKLFILHIRMWKLEDEIGAAKNDTELAELKRKIDFCFKVKRPKLIQVINLMLDDYITKNKNFVEPNVKNYKGVTNV